MERETGGARGRGDGPTPHPAPGGGRVARGGAIPAAVAPEPAGREIDARLALGAVAAWLVVLSALRAGAGWLTVAVMSGAAAVAGLAVLAWTRHRRGPAPTARLTRIGPALALVLFCVTVAMLPLAARLRQTQTGAVHQLAVDRASGTIEATVSGDPHRRASSNSPISQLLVEATMTSVRAGPHSYRLHAPVLVVATDASWDRLVPGQRIRLDGRLAPGRDGDLRVATVIARGSPLLIGRPPWWQREAQQVRVSLREACRGLPPAERGLLPGLVDGDTSGLDPVLAEQFRAAGLTHLVAVSGTNAAILIGAVLLILRRFGARPWVRALIGGLTLLAFVIVARPSPSVLRAAVMAAVLLIALALGRPRQGLPALSAAVLALLLWHPEWAVNPGFAMSVLATGALLLVAPGWAVALRRRHVPAGIAEGLAVAAAASAVTAPVVVLLSGQVSLVSLPANLLAEIAVAPATVLGVLAASVAPWWPDGGALLAQCAGYPCRWLVGVGGFFGSVRGGTVSWPATLYGAVLLMVIIVLLVLTMRLRRARIILSVVVLTALVVQIPLRRWSSNWPVPGAIFIACDVGQGDGLVLPTAAHRAIVIDSGVEPVAIDRCLRSLQITQIDVFVVSHFDSDHVGGAEGVVRGRRVGTVLMSPMQQPPGGVAILTRALRASGVNPAIPAPGSSIDVGAVHLDVLASRAVYENGAPDTNDSCLITMATVARRRILLLCDAGPIAQQALLASGVDLRADVLKVAHHGSAYFESALYAAVHAQLAVISVGAHNTYGHPTPRALAELAQLGLPVERTDQDGDVAVVPSAGGLRVVTHREGGTKADGRPGRSEVRATMSPWRLPRIPPLLHPSDTRASSWSSAMRSSSSVAPSSRSPPPPAGTIRPPRWCRSPAPR